MFGRRSRRDLRAHRRGLASYDPDERMDAASALVKLGLTRRTASVLRSYLSHEEDPEVRFELALAVVRGSGERSRRHGVRRLQKWAVDQLLEHGHPAHQRLEWQRTRVVWAPAPQS
jgi:hypothetical protein